eukprot:jgi/Bigna1/145718/aug1.102_g20426
MTSAPTKNCDGFISTQEACAEDIVKYGVVIPDDDHDDDKSAAAAAATAAALDGGEEANRIEKRRWKFSFRAFWAYVGPGTADFSHDFLATNIIFSFLL